MAGRPRTQRQPASAYSAEMAEWLAARGHSVSVVTASPYYPNNGRHGRAGRYAREERAGPCAAPAGAAAARRRQALLHLASFALSSLPSLLRRRRAADVLVVEPALFCVPVRAWLAAVALAPDAGGSMKWTPRSSWACSGRLAAAPSRRALADAPLRPRFHHFRTHAGAGQGQAWSPPAPCCCRTGSTRRRSADLDGGAYRAQLGIPADAIVALFRQHGRQTGPAGPGRRDPPPGRRNAVWFVFCGQGPERAACARRAAPDWRAHASGPAARRTPGRAAVHGGSICARRARPTSSCAA